MEALMKVFSKHFDFANAAAFTCFTCHQGAKKVLKNGRAGRNMSSRHWDRCSRRSKLSAQEQRRAKLP
jgi:hypothetical protein